MADLVLPAGVRALVERHRGATRNPGLLLDKFSWSPRQEQQREPLEAVCAVPGDAELLAALRARRSQLAEALGAVGITATLVSPLTLHLSRAIALENAALALHPVYGFAYLPATGVKGLTRSWAETVWLPAQPDRPAAEARIHRLFGAIGGDGTAGAVVFLEAWPQVWPRLMLDVITSHHGGYYQGSEPPGDWQNPVPVSFLAVAPGTAFEFLLALRPGETDRSLLEIAVEWLKAALVRDGAGAKTAAGYGRFALAEGRPAGLADDRRSRFETELRLATPAFLAGARQEEEDCRLRVPTLRGQLRWWWRTLHAGHLAVDDLRRLEAAVWGSTGQGSPVQIALEDLQAPRVARYDYKDGFAPKAEFARKHDLEQPSKKRTTQGLFYASYGMADGDRKRWHAEAGGRWRLALTFRGSSLLSATGKAVATIPAEAIREQALAALWLLTHHGGVGSKARKGFGSLADVDVGALGSLPAIKDAARRLRESLALRSGRCGTPALEDAILAEVATPWRDPWFALDQTGFSLQAFAQAYKGQPDKRALGRPRNVGGERDRGNERHAAPLHLHLAEKSGGGLLVRAIAFPSERLPMPNGDPQRNLAIGRKLVAEQVRHLETDLAERARRLGAKGQRVTTSRDASTPRVPEKWAEVQAVLLEERTRSGGWKAKLRDGELAGGIENHARMPPEAAPGQEVRLIVKVNDRFNPVFLWPTPEVEALANRNRGGPPPPGRPGGPGRPPGRR